jgi:hypothetical protein
MGNFDVTAGRAFDENGSDAILLKLSTFVVEANIYIPVSDLDKILKFCSGNIENCTSGKSANSPVFWRKGDLEEFYILVGNDDEVWDIGLTLDYETIKSISDELNKIPK